MSAFLFDELVELIGLTAATALSRQWGGRSLHVPHRPGAHTPLVAAVGASAAAELGRRYGGDCIQIPNAPGKHARVREMRGAGASISTIAGETGYTMRYVRKILAADPPAPAAEPPPPPLLALMRKV